MAQNDGTLVMHDARLIFKNFAGKEGQYNQAGDRNFCILLDDETADAMDADGWNIKELRAREEGDTPQKYLPVSIKYRGRNGADMRKPRLVMITSKGRTDLTEEECELFDWVDIQKVDLIVRPYHWEVSGNRGTKAYLKSIYVTIEEDELEQKYNELPELGATPALTTGDDDIIDAEAWEMEEQKQLTTGSDD
jgi:hypothetical protein